MGATRPAPRGVLSTRSLREARRSVVASSMAARRLGATSVDCLVVGRSRAARLLALLFLRPDVYGLGMFVLCVFPIGIVACSYTPV